MLEAYPFAAAQAARVLRLVLATFAFAAGQAWAAGGVQPPPGSVPLAVTLDELGSTGPEPVEKIAKALRGAGVAEAYGFVAGARIAEDPANAESIRLWLRYGYQIGNHTFSHRSLSDVSADVFMQDILENETVLKRFARPGDDWHWFRYPYLSEGETVAKKATVRSFLQNMPTGQNYRIAEVTVDYADWLFDAAYSRCLEQGRTDRIAWLKEVYLHKATYSFMEAQANARGLFGRDIPHILLVHYSRFTGEIMADLLAALKADGARFVTLGEAQSDPVFETDPETVLPHGDNFLNTRLLARFPPTNQGSPARVSAWKAQVNSACTEVPGSALP